ncbi:hypothetical protein QR680_009966 [Steinernema hermaphroditum]|uniref:Domain of unknown function WSN domain-containing protein n=1 Tax=Steinernema hermaphroditum TaxID=289476 RepID=A0AA39IPS4_9BILA|nr:hypothetical protein QR680_009966 [Steinernema hermaphroditum]
MSLRIRVIPILLFIATAFCEEEFRLSIQRADIERLMVELVPSLQSLAPKIPMSSGEEFDTLLREIDEVVSSSNKMNALVASSMQLSEFARMRPDIKEVIETHKVGEWGTVRDLRLIALKMKYEEIPKILEWVVDPTPLEAALDLAKEEHPDKASEIKALRDDVSSTLRTTRQDPYDTKMAKLSATFAKYPNLTEELANTAIGDFGNLEEFFGIAQNYYRLSVLKRLFSSNSSSLPSDSRDEEAPDAPITENLFDAIDDNSFNWSREERKALGNLTVAIRATTHAKTVAALRESTLSAFHQLIKRYPKMFERVRQIKVGKELNFGTFGDLIDTFNYEASDRGASLLESQGSKPIFLQAFDSSRSLMPTLLQDAIGDLEKQMESALAETDDLDKRILSLHKFLSEFIVEYAFFGDKLFSMELGEWGTTRTFMEIGQFLSSKYGLNGLIEKRLSMNADYDEIPKSELEMDLQDIVDNSTFRWTRSDMLEIEGLVASTANLSVHSSFTENRNLLLESYASLSEGLRERLRSVPMNSTTFGQLIDALYFDTVSKDAPPASASARTRVSRLRGNCSEVDELLKPSDLGEPVLIASMRKALDDWPIGAAALFKTFLKRVELLLAHNAHDIRPAIETLAAFSNYANYKGPTVYLKKTPLAQWGTVGQLLLC